MDDVKDINYAESYRIIDGRKYINDENYIYYLPNDEEESDRTNLEHSILRYVWQGNFSSEIKGKLIRGNTKVIDLGCGSGQWLTDMASKYPLSTFIGIDVCPLSFTASKPDNVAFLQHNLLDNPGIPFPDKTFDFVFLKNLSLDATNSWAHVINEMVRVASLNACIEIMNFDLDKDTYDGPILNLFHSASMFY
jgi:ubiquinone/menaquinone biosynthesis C-methylase UbiE